MHRGFRSPDQVTGYRRFSVYGGEYLQRAQPMPPKPATEAVWFTFEPSYLFGAGVTEEDGPGTLHAAEHAATGCYCSSPPATAGTWADSPRCLRHWQAYLFLP